jgi:hypothetical protein
MGCQRYAFACLLISSLAGAAWADEPPVLAPPEPTSAPVPDVAPVPSSLDANADDGATAAEPPPCATGTGTCDPPPLRPRFDPDAPPPSGWRFMFSDLTIIRLNPLGLETRGRLGLQKRLYYSEKAISRNNFAFAGLYPKLNPASAQLGVGGEVQPLSMFNLRALAEVQQYFGTVGYLQSFPSADASWSDQRRKDLVDDPVLAPQSAGMFHASIQPMLMAKVGPIAFRALLLLDYWSFDVRAGDVAAYEGTFDTLLPDRGWTISTDTDLLYTGRRGLAIGLRHSSVTPRYRREHFADAAAEAAYDGDNAHQRLGLFAAYTLRDRGPSRFNKPTLILIASWYLKHRYRLGQPDVLPAGHDADDYVSRAFPYLLVGFAFESDLRTVRR